MKNIFSIFLFLLLPIITPAQTKSAFDCFNKAVAQYNNGKYDSAKMLFESCKKFTDDLDLNNINTYIENCDKKINSRQKAIKDAKEAAARADATKRAVYEAKLSKRISDCLVRIVSDAYLFDKEYDLRSTVAGALSNAGFNMTDNQDESRWSVYVTAYAYEDDVVTKPYWENNKLINDNEYWAGVNVRVKIVDEINGKIIYENEILDREEDYVDYNKNFEKAAKQCYATLKPQLGKEIVNNLNQYRQ